MSDLVELKEKNRFLINLVRLAYIEGYEDAQKGYYNDNTFDETWEDSQTEMELKACVDAEDFELEQQIDGK